MTKIALLIGISDYDCGLPRLSGTQTDIQAMKRVLESDQVGKFDRVELLSSPQRTEMEKAIETLFTENRSSDDLVLLYFSGHGVKDMSGTLYLTAKNTEPKGEESIRSSTAVSSRALQDYMGQSRSERQVLILDCCFSGAFAKDMLAKGERTLDIQAQLGGTGRAVLTSSTEMQESFEEGGLSIYTRYLVQGLETGAADQNGDGKVRVDELHEYAKEKVREAAPSMQPEIYAVREGYKIVIARAPQDDPKLVYRKALNERAKEKRGRFSPIDRRALKFKGRELGLSAEEIKQLEQEILQPYVIFGEKLDEFEQAVKETLEHYPQWGESSVDDLLYLQRTLKLRDDDIGPVLNQYGVTLELPSVKDVPVSPATAPPVTTSPAPVKSVSPQSSKTVEEIKLESQKGVDYTNLRDLLAAEDWKGADWETYLRMLEVVGRTEGDWIRDDELLNFPCADLKTIDRLWVYYSQGQFGFSVQKQIYVEYGAQLNGEYPGDNIWRKFCTQVGWRVNDSYISYSDVIFTTKAPRAHLPYYELGLRGGIRSLLSHSDL